jgi:predicted dinucleotide-binding enzyme
MHETAQPRVRIRTKEGRSMTLGFIGAGQLAQAFAFRAIAAGLSVTLSNSRGPSSLAEIVSRLGPKARAGTTLEAASSDTVVLAVPGEMVGLALATLRPWDGQTLVDATNHQSQPDPLPGVLSSSEMIAELARGANVVKALNTVNARTLAEDPEPHAGLRRLLFACGDDIPSKDAFRGLLEQLGYATIDLGGLAEGSRLQQYPGGALAAVDLLRVT